MSRWGGVDGMGSGLRLPSDTVGLVAVPNEPLMVSKLYYKVKAGLSITVMNEWEQPHTNAPLLKPSMHCYSVFSALQGHKKPISKSRPGYLLLFYCGAWIVHECGYKVSQ